MSVSSLHAKKYYHINRLEVLPRLVLPTFLYTSVRSGVRYVLSQTPEIRMSEFDKSSQTLASSHW